MTCCPLRPRRCAAAPLLVLVVCAVLGAPAPAAGQDATRFADWAWHDAGAFVHHATTEAPFYAVGVGLMLAPIGPADDQLLRLVQRDDGGLWGRYLDATNHLGGPRMPTAAAGVFAVTLLTDDTRLQDAAFTSLQTLVFAGFTTRALKLVAGRVRPEDGRGGLAPFSGNTSFPSGHTTAAFALVTPWVLYYRHPVTYGLFALSAGTAIARVAHDKHWPSDVLAGAAIGYFTGRFLVRRHQSNPAPTPRLAVEPLVLPGAAGLSIRVYPR